MGREFLEWKYGPEYLEVLSAREQANKGKELLIYGLDHAESRDDHSVPCFDRDHGRDRASYDQEQEEWKEFVRL